LCFWGPAQKNELKKNHKKSGSIAKNDALPITIFGAWMEVHEPFRLGPIKIIGAASSAT
jgi:hypothetical protein